MDNNAIGAAVDAGLWRALSGGYRLETVDQVADEAGTYFRKLPNHVELAADFEARVKVHPVSEDERSALLTRIEGIALDPGELDLWAHALPRTGEWIFCGPDKASMRTAMRLGLRERVVSLEHLLRDAGSSVKGLDREHSEKWLQATFSQLALDEMPART